MPLHTTLPTSTSRRPSMLFGRRSITAKASFSDDEDAITPCSSPPPETTTQQGGHHAAGISSFHPSSSSSSSPHYVEPRAASSSSWFSSFSRRGSAAGGAEAATSSERHLASWHFDPTDGEDMDDARLWRRMLEIQREFHCYNSARMAAALLELEMGMAVGPYAPSRGCLDLLNDSVSDMPEHEKERLVDWLHDHSNRRKRSGIFKRASGF